MKLVYTIFFLLPFGLYSQMTSESFALIANLDSAPGYFEGDTYSLNASFSNYHAEGGAILSTNYSLTPNLENDEPTSTSLPSEFMLLQNYPNPFNPVTSIEYQISHATHVEMIVYDVRGNIVEKIVDDYQYPGFYTLEWFPSGISSGIYFYSINTFGYHATGKCVYMK